MAGPIDVQALRALLDRETAVRCLHAYFAEDGEQLYTGRRFESFAGGGDRPETADRFTADDVVAVSLLSVDVPGEVAISIVEGPSAEPLSALLRAIPTDVALADDRAEALVAPRSPAGDAWTLLEGLPGVGWVTAGKLMARKRPKLLPVYDRVVRCVLGHPDDFWRVLRTALRADDGAVGGELDRIRRDAGLDGRLSTIRTLDVVLWMRHHEKHRLGECGVTAR